MNILTSLAAVVALAATAPAFAQAQSNEPLDIAADELEVQNNQCIAIWRGAAEALQKGARLRADVMTAQFEKKVGANGAAGANCGNVVSVDAKGSVYYVTADGNRARGDAAFYDASKSTVTLTGDVIAVQGQNVIRGSRMVFNSDTGEGHMVGAATGRNKQGRVRGVFYPQKSASNDGQRR